MAIHNEGMSQNGFHQSNFRQVCRTDMLSFTKRNL